MDAMTLLIWTWVAGFLTTLLLSAWFARKILACERGENGSVLLAGMLFVALIWPYVLSCMIVWILEDKIEDWWPPRESIIHRPEEER